MDLVTDLRRAGETDDLSASVDYGDVCRRVLRIGTERSFHLIEALAETIARMVLDVYPVERVRVRVTKTPPPALNHALSALGTIEYSAVDITRTRESRRLLDTST
jgi:FolB domain-containing protein